MKKNKVMFLMMLIMSTMMIMSSENWISMWMGMEMNMMAFIPMMSQKNNNKSPESKMTYFLIQSMTSMLIILMIMINPMMTTNTEMMEKTTKTIMMMSIGMKIGMAPMHLWLISIMSKMNWNNCMILMTWQKMAPMIMMSNIFQEKISIILIMMSTTVGAMGGINQTSIQKIMAYSSINHTGWMLLCMKTESDLWMKYWMIYSIMIMLMTKMFEKNSTFHINQMIMNTKSKMEKMNYIIMFMSLGGLPPFIGFLPKWMAIQSSIKTESKIMLMIMMMMSMITLYYYIRMMSPMLMMQSMKNKWINKMSSNKNTKMMMLTNISMPIILILNMI